MYWKPDETQARYNGVRLLLVGESAYQEGAGWSEDETRSHAREMVLEYGVRGSRYQRFFANVFTAFTGLHWSAEAERQSFWNSIYFHNYVRRPMNDRKERPSKADFRASDDSFHQVLNDVKPEAVVVLGVWTWQNMSERDAAPFDVCPELGSRWRYQIGHDTHALVAHIRHPSSFGFLPHRWQPGLTGLVKDAAAVS